jgi:hypothetical protein
MIAAMLICLVTVAMFAPDPELRARAERVLSILFRTE